MGFGDLLGLLELTVVVDFVFCGGDVVERAVQATLIPPFDPLEGGQLDLVGGAPRPSRADQFGLVQAIDRLGERVVERVAPGADRSHRALVGQPLAVAHAQVLPGFKGSSQHGLVGSTVAAR